MPIENHTTGTRALLREIMGGASEPDEGGRDEDVTEVLRTAWARSGTRTTFVVPGDFPEDPARWYPTDAPTYPRRQKNNVEYLRDGQQTFDAMLEAIETASSPDHFIILLGWALHTDFTVTNGSSRHGLTGLSMKEIFEKKTREGVKIRVLLWYNTTPPEYTAWGTKYAVHAKTVIDRLNPPPPAPQETPRRAICILDESTRDYGSHHQKILLVYGRDGLVGFFGGVDVNSDRVNAEPIRAFIGPGLLDAGGPLHDVHARVTGEAAEDLLVLATNRWNFSKPVDVYRPMAGHAPPGVHAVDPALSHPAPMKLPDSGRALEDMTRWLEAARGTKVPVPPPYHNVRIAHTIGNPRLEVKGQICDAWPLIRHAIQQAKRFVYIEDQYFWNLEIADELARALATIERLIILLPPDDPIGERLRHRALQRLVDGAAGNVTKIGLYTIKETFHQYIHAKMFVLDDELAIIGSANSNNRGYFHDSEVIGAITDPKWDEETGPRAGKWYRLELNLAHKLRMELWAEHLRLQAARLHEPIASTLYFDRLPPGGKLQRYRIGALDWYDVLVLSKAWLIPVTTADTTLIDPR